MRVKVLSHENFNQLMYANKINDDTVEDVKDSIFISIVGTHADKDHWFTTDHPNVLNLEFDDRDFSDRDKNLDCSLPGNKFFDDDMAGRIIKMLEDNKDTAKNAYIHCAYGVSRSGAVGEVINNYYSDDKYEVFKRNNPQVIPNVYVKSVLSRAYYNYED